MSSNLKKILIILGFVVIVTILAFIIYFTFFRSKPIEEKATPVVETPATGLPISDLVGEKPTPKPAGTGVLGETLKGGLLNLEDLTFNSVKNITISNNGSDIQYYDPDTGLFYTIDKNNNVNELSDKRFFNVENATWSQDKNKAVLEYPDGSNIVYDFKTKKQVTLPKHWEDFQFSPDGNKIISKSMSDDVNARWLITSNIDGTQIKAITPLGENADKVQVAWSPNNQVVAFSSTGDSTSDGGIEEIYLLGQNNENFKSLKVRGFDFKAKWAEEGDKILYNVTDPGLDFKPTLWITNVAGENIGTNSVKIGLDTWVDKCTIVKNYRAYCAVPKNLDEGAGLEPRVANDSDDVIYSINLKTGKTTFIGEPTEDYSIDQISISNKEDYVFFTDRDGTLHKMKIE